MDRYLFFPFSPLAATKVLVVSQTRGERAASGHVHTHHFMSMTLMLDC
jgi:hypothetical protein